MSNKPGTWTQNLQDPSSQTHAVIDNAGQQPQHGARNEATENYYLTLAEGQPSDGLDHGFYQCGTCKKTYNRADHLIRHVRSHTHEKPYVCDVCNKGFARPDLLKRHAAGHDDHEKNDVDGGPTKKRKTATAVDPSQTSRVMQACKSCASSKLKCSEGKPCERCKKKHLVCEDSSPGESSTPGRQTVYANGSDSAASSSNLVGDARQDATQTLQGHLDPSKSAASDHQPYRPQTTVADGVLEVSGTYFPEFLRHVVAAPGSNDAMAGIDISTSFNQSYFPQNYVDYGMGDGDYGWSSDLWYSDGLQDAFNMPFESTFTPYPATLSSSSDSPSGAGVGADAFKRSLIGSWTPLADDSSMMERQNLMMPRNADSSSIFTESKLSIQEPLSLSSRDRILGMVLETCPQTAAGRIIASFPSAEFLNDCIRYYFARRHEEQIDSYIHLPTFKPNEQRPELLAMLAGAGAVCTSSFVVRKLGYALQEAVRHAMGRRVCCKVDSRTLKASR
jgi:Fungal Zn(2)-Cys(6) binuclear cluster domain/Zinc finger, C2H2 type